MEEKPPYRAHRIRTISNSVFLLSPTMGWKVAALHSNSAQSREEGILHVGLLRNFVCLSVWGIGHTKRKTS